MTFDERVVLHRVAQLEVWMAERRVILLQPKVDKVIHFLLENWSRSFKICRNLKRFLEVNPLEGGCVDGGAEGDGPRGVAFSSTYRCRLMRGWRKSRRSRPLFA